MTISIPTRLKENWNLLAQGAALVATLLAGFVVAPPPGVHQAGENSVWNLGRFVLTILIGLLLVPCSRYKRRKDLRPWVFATGTTLLTALVVYFLYGSYLESWTCRFAGQSVVIGDKLTEHGKDFV